MVMEGSDGWNISNCERIEANDLVIQRRRASRQLYPLGGVETFPPPSAECQGQRVSIWVWERNPTDRSVFLHNDGHLGRAAERLLCPLRRRETYGFLA